MPSSDIKFILFVVPAFAAWLSFLLCRGLLAWSYPLALATAVALYLPLFLTGPPYVDNQNRIDFKGYLPELLGQACIPLLSANLIFHFGPALHLDRGGSQIAALVGFVAASFGTTLLAGPKASRSRDEELRGTTLRSFAEAEQLAERARAKDDPGLIFGGLRLPFDAALKHFLCIGSPGSGKTLTIRMLMESVLPRVGKRPDLRAVILDVKGNMYSLLAGMPGVDMARVRLLNPFDARGYAWDIAADCRTAQDCEHLAEAFIPEKMEGDPFWADAPRAILAAVLNVYRKKARTAGGRPDWTLRDVILAFSSPERLRAVLEQTPEGRDTIATYFEPADTFRASFSSASTYLGKLAVIAEAWNTLPPSQQICLADWFDPAQPDHDAILVLRAASSKLGAGLTTINRVIFTRIAQLILEDPLDDMPPRHFLFLDETNDAGKLNNLVDLLTKGRSKGCSATLGLQSLPALQIAFGDKEATVLAGLCGNKAYLRMEDEETATWAQGSIADTEILETSRSYNTAKADEINIKEDIKDTYRVKASEFINLPDASAEGGFYGFFKTRVTGLYRHWLEPAFIQTHLHGPDPATPPLEKHTTSDELTRWERADLQRLGLPATVLDAEPPDAATPTAGASGRTPASQEARKAAPTPGKAEVNPPRKTEVKPDTGEVNLPDKAEVNLPDDTPLANTPPPSESPHKTKPSLKNLRP